MSARARVTRWGALVVGCLLLTAACGGGSDGAGGTGGAAATGSDVPDTTAILQAVTKDPQLAAALPAQIAQAGALNIGSNIQSAPNNFYSADGKTPVGFEVDIAKAVAAKLGVTAHHTDMAFGSLITSLQSGRLDLTMAGMNDTKARQAQIDFVDYFTSGITIMVRKGNPDGITGPDSLCGKTVAVVQGTSHQTFAAEQSTRCVQAGKPAITTTATDSDSQNQNQLRTGRVAAILNDLPTAAYVSKNAGNGEFFEVVPGEPINGGPYGIGVNKANPQLRDAVEKALSALVADGTYGKILDAWGVEQGAITKVTVNAGS
ncbi:ABC transporter substrate-binding protein [Amycolatopsis thermophila]|uniref:Polar amino acid transport system substrate-binding protein n=1 Tax=Amycolatopsis thermophila TaxID=206084 RepID=A0ABU0F0J1_9PSEU|nr:ABC transporter substrate-binding protein [Amycolatopsis thermophila]MDQ0380587.1 polar amino acid transport system substrate-binding protein [Amycolatopsis thermophila]